MYRLAGRLEELPPVTRASIEQAISATAGGERMVLNVAFNYSSRSEIVDAVRGDNYPVTDRSVDVQIAGLRKKLGQYSSYIETVRGVGYRFRDPSGL